MFIIDCPRIVVGRLNFRFVFSKFDKNSEFSRFDKSFTSSTSVRKEYIVLFLFHKDPDKRHNWKARSHGTSPAWPDGDPGPGSRYLKPQSARTQIPVSRITTPGRLRPPSSLLPPTTGDWTNNWQTIGTNIFCKIYNLGGRIETNIWKYKVGRRVEGSISLQMSEVCGYEKAGCE